MFVILKIDIWIEICCSEKCCSAKTHDEGPMGTQEVAGKVGKTALSFASETYPK